MAEAHYTGGVFITGPNKWDSNNNNALSDASKNKTVNFIESITSGNYINEIEDACNSTLTAMLGREAALKNCRLTWDEMIAENQRYGDQPDLSQF
jgi:hypothetical protein